MGSAPHVLLLGGSAEASALARALAAAGMRATYSYAGRVTAPTPQPLPTRMGGFGGIEGLVAYLQSAGVSHVVDATHPFAATISAHAVAACTLTGTPLCALERPAWSAEDGDRWISVPTLAAAAAALHVAPASVFLAIGRQNLDVFAVAPQHHYLLRVVEAPATPPPLPHHRMIVSRGPFSVAEDTALMKDHGVEWIVAKNAGGEGARAKLLAARALRIPVLMVERPAISPRPTVGTVAEVLAWLGLDPHGDHRGV